MLVTTHSPLPARRARRTRRPPPLVALVTLLAVAACTDAARDAAAPPPVPAAVVARSGGWQLGTPGEALAEPLVAAVVDGRGEAVSDALVHWSVDDGGEVTPAESRTDANGEAHAAWTLGPTTPHRAHASAGIALDASFVAIVGGEPPPDGGLMLLDVATYDGSGQVVHPDVASTPATWGTGPRQLAITPYPFGNSAYENPSLFVAPDESHWEVPSGVGNPVVRPTSGYLSDPDLVFDPAAGSLRLYYRAVDDENHVLLATSRDGAHWSAPVEVVRGPNHTIVSPAVVRRSATDWWMWSVDGGGGCQAATAAVDVRRSRDGVHWSAPTRVRLEQPGFYPWHIDVQWMPTLGEFWALYNGKRGGSCTTPALFLARSTNGVDWTTYPSPVLARGAIPALQDVVYRTTFAYDPGTDVVTLWYSGARYENGAYVWRAAMERRMRATLLASVAAGMRAVAIPDARPGVPPLVDAP